MLTTINLTPNGLPSGPSRAPIANFIVQLEKLVSSDLEAEVESVRRVHLRSLERLPPDERRVVTAVTNIIADLAKQGWQLFIKDDHIHGRRPEEAELTESERSSKRAKLAARRNEQLREPATREFIKSMERSRITGSGRSSIFTFMRDGRDLAANVHASRDDAKLNPAAVQPSIQFISTGATDPSGFLLQDLWRYFRHTWANPYESVPGRSMLLLVRDRAVSSEPVVGIAAISSAAMQLETRDKYIGWHGKTFLKECIQSPTAEVADWVLHTLDRAMDGIYRTDLIERNVLSSRLPNSVPEEVIDTLRTHGRETRDAHMRRANPSEFKPANSVDKLSDEDWEEYARTLLFQSKRAIELASLLSARNLVTRTYEGRAGNDRLVHLLSTSAGRETFLRVVKAARSMTVGTEIADLTVCGAVPPYNELLGGKLVAMLSVSPEVVAEYKRRYGEMPSVIASSMAGRRVVRPANLVFVSTTSLYGERPNQYDRISIPATVVAGSPDDFIRYKALNEKTEGVGTFHFSKATKKALEDLETALKNGRRVKNVFGEGTNPRLRALRDGMVRTGFDADILLNHGLQKQIYAVSLIKNLRDYLLGFSETPQYILPTESPAQATEAICEFWHERWANKRASRPEFLEKVSNHTLVHPISHGARVVLPDDDLEQYTFPWSKGVHAL